MSTTRRRALPFKGYTGTRLEVETTPWDAPVRPITRDVYRGGWVPSYLQGTQVTVSENHPGWNSRRRGSPGDIGGDFSSEKTYVDWKPTRHVMTKKIDSVSNRWTIVSKYDGFLVASSLVGQSFPSSIKSSNTVLDAWGAKAIARTNPTNRLTDLSVTLGELLNPGGIPRLMASMGRWEGMIEQARRAGSDYLNAVFGWQPLANDITNLAVSIVEARKILEQYERDAGRVVRRRMEFEPVTTESNQVLSVNDGFWWNPSTGDVGGPKGRLIRRNTTSVRRWFSGAFTYHLPTGYSSRKKVISIASQADRLLGLTITPDTLWELTPWSWAMDWVTNMGNVVSNVRAWSKDGLVMQYGYMMEHSISRNTYLGAVENGSPHVPDPISIVRESKLRRRANPFGFGLTWAGLSPRQVAIAAALGITKW